MALSGFPDVLHIRQRLLDAPLKHIASVASYSIKPFADEWDALCEDINRAKQLSLLQEEDIALIHAQASLIATMSSGVHDMYTQTEKMSSLFVVEIQEMFSQISLDSLPTQEQPTALLSSVRPSLPYLQPAYIWMLRNLHDPYPSLQTKKTLAREGGVTVHSLNNWFKEIRRHIGWVALCKTHFQGSRALAVEVAHKVFVEDEVQCTLSPSLIAEFYAVRTRLEGCFEEEADTPSSSPSTESPSPSSSFVTLPTWHSSSSSRAPALRSVSSTPSLRSVSSTPSLTFSSDADDDSDAFVDPPIVTEVPWLTLATQGKRKRSNDEEAPSKRSRCVLPLYRQCAVYRCSYCLSRSASVEVAVPDAQPTISPSALMLMPAEASEVLPSISRHKRRFSDAAAEWEEATTTPAHTTTETPQILPKRRSSMSAAQPSSKRQCRNLPMSGRKQTVSDPFPRSNEESTLAVDDWFKDAFTFTEPSSVELSNGWDLGNINNGELSLSYALSSLSDHELQRLSLTSCWIQLCPATSLHRDFQTMIST